MDCSTLGNLNPALILLTFFFFATATLVDAGRRMLFHATGIDLCFTKAGDSVTSLIRDGYFIRNNEREREREREREFMELLGGIRFLTC